MAGNPYDDIVAQADGRTGEANPYDAFMQAPASPAAPPTKLESLGRGALQGATMGFSDEIAGAINAAATKEPGWLGGLLASSPLASTIYSLIKKDKPELLADYRTGRDSAREANTAAQEANPASYLAGEVGGGLAGVAIPIPGAGVGAVAKTAPALVRAGVALGKGAAYGSVAGLGQSTADLTQGDVAGSVRDVSKGAAMGATATPIAHGVVKVAGKLVSAFRPGVDKAAEKVADEVAAHADELAGAGHTQPIGTFYERSQQLEKQLSEKLGESFRFRPSQATGYPDLALAESKALQSPETMRPAQALEAKQLRQSAQVLDGMIDSIASDPAKLGKSEVGNAVAGAVERHIEDLRALRSNAAGPLYKAASEAARGARVIPTDATRAAMADIMDANKFDPGKITAQVRAAMGKVEGAATAKGRITIDDMQNLRSFWGRVASSDETILEGLDKANQRRLARSVLGGIDADLEMATKGIASKRAAELMQQANAAWREGSQAIDSVSTDILDKLLKTEASGAADTITDKILRASPDQVSSVFGVLQKTSPETASQLRAQMLEDLFARAGKPQRGGAIASELGVAELHPKTAMNLLERMEPKLRAAFGDDPKASQALRTSFELLQRLSYGPGLKGSQTAPLLMELAQEKGAEKIGEKLVEAGGAPAKAMAEAYKMLKPALGNAKAMGHLLSTPEGIDTFNKYLRVMIAGSHGARISPTVVKGLMASMTLLGAGSMIPREQNPQLPMNATAEVSNE